MEYRKSDLEDKIALGTLSGLIVIGIAYLLGIIGYMVYLMIV